MTGEAPEGSQSEKKGRVRASPLRSALIRDVLIVFVGALTLSTLMRVFVFQMFDVLSGSMENTLMTGDRIVAQKVVGYQRGDIIVFADTLGWTRKPRTPSTTADVLAFLGLGPDLSRNTMVKRVVGLPGDRVVCCNADSLITINGFPVDPRGYLYTDPVTEEPDEPSMSAFDIVVPVGKLFVLGDHRSNSEDSRYFLCNTPAGQPKGSAAFVPQENVIGTVVAIVFPFDQFTGLSRPAVFDGVPPPDGPAPPEPIINLFPC